MATDARSPGARLGSMPADSEQDLRFAQDRVALFGKVTFTIAILFLIATSAADLRTETPRYEAVGRASHAVGAAIALALWLGLRRRRSTFSPGALQAIDIGATVAICWAFAAMGHHAMQPYGGYTALISMSYVCVARAALVPSIPRRTMLISLASFGAFIVSRALLPGTEVVSRPRGVLEATLWSGAGTALVTIASSVIYGLQERARAVRQLGQYRLAERIGSGGMGEVYRAHHAMLRRPTAVKLLAGDGSERQLRRFEKEVQLTARLTHPNTISIYDYGRTPDGVFYYAMELLDGVTLQQLVENHGPQPPGRVIHILGQVCGALTEAHVVGLIHRDIKPANIHLSRRAGIADFVKVLDFGLVRELHGDVDLTASSVNTVVGTPLYMAPEAILTPDQLDARADLYGVGCVAYFLLTGEPPFTGANVVELGAQHLHSAPPRPSAKATVAEDLESVILSCLAKSRDDRPKSARDLAHALSACADADAWRPADAEAWWTAPRAIAPVTPPPSDEASRRAMVQIDFAHRLERLDALLAELSADEGESEDG